MSPSFFSSLSLSFINAQTHAHAYTHAHAHVFCDCLTIWIPVNSCTQSQTAGSPSCIEDYHRKCSVKTVSAPRKKERKSTPARIKKTRPLWQVRVRERGSVCACERLYQCGCLCLVSLLRTLTLFCTHKERKSKNTLNSTRACAYACARNQQYMCLCSPRWKQLTPESTHRRWHAVCKLCQYLSRLWWFVYMTLALLSVTCALSLCLSFSSSVCLCLCLSLFFPLSLSRSISLSLSLDYCRGFSLCLSLSLSFSLSVSVCVWRSVCWQLTQAQTKTQRDNMQQLTDFRNRIITPTLCLGIQPKWFEGK